MKKIISNTAPFSRLAGVTLVLLIGLSGYGGGLLAAGLEERPNDYKWRLCPAGRLIPIKPGYTDSETDPGSIEIRADSTRLVKEGLSQFTGDVEVVQGEKSLRADVINYDDSAGIFHAEGRAHIWEPGMTWAGESATYDINSQVSELNAGRYWLLGGRGRGAAVRYGQRDRRYPCACHPSHVKARDRPQLPRSL